MINNVIILGDLIIDKYINCTYNRINRETPSIIYEEKDINYKLGGAGNVSCNLTNLNINIFFISYINDNSNIKNLLNYNNINYYYSDLNKKYNNCTKTRFISNNNQIFRYDKKKINKINYKKIQENFLKCLDENKISLIILSDYNLGLLNTNFSRFIIKNSKNIPIFSDPRINNINKFKNTTLLKPNRNEFLEICKKFNISEEISLYNLEFICKKLDISYIFISLDKDGLLYYNSKTKTLKRSNYKYKLNNVIDVTGAGDVVLSFITYKYLNFIDNFDCKNNQEFIVKLNNYFCNILNEIVKIGTYSCTKLGTYNLNLNDISRLNNIKLIDNDYNSITNRIKLLKKNYSIVFTTGCYDLIHEGHINSLKKCKEYGDIIIVALNSDESIKRIKGCTRPINNFNTRVSILNSFDFVDIIIKLEDDNPYNLLKIIKPDYFIKGNEYTIDNLKNIGGDFAKEIILLERELCLGSTTEIIDTIKNI